MISVHVYICLSVVETRLMVHYISFDRLCVWWRQCCVVCGVWWRGGRHVAVMLCGVWCVVWRRVVVVAMLCGTYVV